MPPQISYNYTESTKIECRSNFPTSPNLRNHWPWEPFISPLGTTRTSGEVGVSKCQIKRVSKMYFSKFYAPCCCFLQQIPPNDPLLFSKLPNVHYTITSLWDLIWIHLFPKQSLHSRGSVVVVMRVLKTLMGAFMAAREQSCCK